MPSSSQIAITSSTVARSAATPVDPQVPSGPRAKVRRLPGQSADSQPPLRPEAPKPTNSASRTTIRSAESAIAR